MPLSIKPILRIKIMSTRATYEFKSANCSLLDITVCFYIHSDNYPEGAAEKLYFMRDTTCLDQCQDYAGQFFRINKRAEFTKNRDVHWDTEYHYVFSKNETLSVFERQINQSWALTYEGDWLVFVNQYQEQSRKLYRFNTSFDFPTTYTLTLKEARAMIEAKKDEARILDENEKTDQAARLRDVIGYLKVQLKIIEDKIESD